MSDLYESEEEEKKKPRRKPLTKRRKVRLPEWRTIDLSAENPEWLDIVTETDVDSDMIDWETMKAFMSSACNNGYEQKKYLGRGNSGSVFQVCKDGDCEKVVKVVPFDDDDEEEYYRISFMEEAEYSFLMGYYGIGPRVHDYWLCPSMAVNHYGKVHIVPGGLMVMDKMDMVLADYIDSRAGEISAEMTESERRELTERFQEEMKVARAKIGQKLRLMDTIKYDGRTLLHRDLHGGNIMVNVDGQDHITDIRFIDFGKLDEDLDIKEAEQRLDDVFEFGIDNAFSKHNVSI